MRYLDVCSGISAPTMAWKPLGWQALCFAEIEPAPRAVLAHHYPDVPLVGDFTKIRGDEYGPVDLLVGGTPCQDFSVAGLRAGLDGERGSLTLEFLRLADRARPRWLVWENVPGVLSIDGGRAFGAILGGLGELGYGWAYRVLDAQHFGVPQRRRRVFVVGYLGDWRRAGAVLFERQSMSGASPPCRAVEQAGAAAVAPCIDSSFGRLQGFSGQDANHGYSHLVACQSFGDGAIYDTGEVAAPLRTGTDTDNSAAIIAFVQNSRDEIRLFGGDGQTVGAVSAELGMKQQAYVSDGWRVRRFTPRETERLFGFPDDFTLVPYRKGMMADGPRYKMLGNSMAVPVVRWIGERIAAVDALCVRAREAA
jgi:DNA (cytosine-5)-methyltransferase 1